MMVLTELDNIEKWEVYTMFPSVQLAVILLFLKKVSKIGRTPAQEVSEASGTRWGTEKDRVFLLV